MLWLTSAAYRSGSGNFLDEKDAPLVQVLDAGGDLSIEGRRRLFCFWEVGAE